MAETGLLLLLFWVFWAVDQLKISRRSRFNLVGGRRRVRIHDGRWHFPGLWPGSWRALTDDIPFSFSPDGITDRGAGQMARPADGPARARAWRWDEIHTADVANGWVRVNGSRFCPDTGHLSAAQIALLARMPAPKRTRTLRRLLHDWVRPAHLRRRAHALIARTSLVSACNATLLLVTAAFTLALLRDVLPLPESWTQVIARTWPIWLAYAAGLHVAAGMAAALALRKLKVHALDGRGTALLSAVLLPPQAMRLRALAGAGFFPPQHPLSFALAFATPERTRLVFQTWADLRWPPQRAEDPAFAQEIAAWFRRELEASLTPHLQALGFRAEKVFAAPAPETAECCRYCPRCRDQFVEPRALCPHGVALLELSNPGTRMNGLHSEKS